MSITLLLPDPLNGGTPGLFNFKTDNKRIHSLATWISEQGDNEFKIYSSEEPGRKRPCILTGPQMEISRPALVALVGVSCSQTGAGKSLGKPGDSRLFTVGPGEGSFATIFTAGLHQSL